MPSDTFEGRRAEITAALAVVDRQIRGLDDLLTVKSWSPNTAEALTAIRAGRSQRRDLLFGELSVLNQDVSCMAALAANGYPDLPKPVASPQVIIELEEQASFIAAAFAEFGLKPRTTGQEPVKQFLTIGKPIPQ